MLEVINGFLIVYFICLCTINALVPQIVKPIVTCFLRPSNEERKIWRELLQLKSEQSKISMKEEFAAYSKLQRKIYRLETQLKEDSQSRMSKSLAIKGSVRIVLQAVITIIIVTSVIWFRREPVVALKGDLFPFTKALQYPSDVPNAISLHIWVIITNFSVRCLLKPLTS